MTEPNHEMPESGDLAKIARGGLQIAGAVPYVGGVFSAIAGAWSERARENKQLFQTMGTNARR